jgi:hypothetical protein
VLIWQGVDDLEISAIKYSDVEYNIPVPYCRHSRVKLQSETSYIEARVTSTSTQMTEHAVAYWLMPELWKQQGWLLLGNVSDRSQGLAHVFKTYSLLNMKDYIQILNLPFTKS